MAESARKGATASGLRVIRSDAQSHEQFVHRSGSVPVGRHPSNKRVCKLNTGSGCRLGTMLTCTEVSSFLVMVLSRPAVLIHYSALDFAQGCAQLVAQYVVALCAVEELPY